MAELNYVKSGQQVGAHTINGIIDSLGGPSTPSDGSFRTVGNGSLFQKSYNLGSNADDAVYEFLDVFFGQAPASLSSVYKTIYINLGRDIDFAKEQLKAVGIYSFDGDTENLKEIQQSDFEVNGSDRFYDGFVCTDLSTIQKFTIKNGESEEEVGYGDGNLYGMLFQAEDDDTEPKYVITNESDVEKVANAVSKEAEDLKKKEILATSTPSENGYQLIKVQLGDVEAKYVPGDADVDWESEKLSGQTHLSSIHRAEISGTTYYQLHNFELSDNVQLSDLSDVQADVLVRKIDGKDHTLEYVALSALSGTSCSADSEIESLHLSSIAVADVEGDGKAYQLYNFDKDTVTGKDELSAYNPAVLVRKIDGNDHTLEYVALSDVSNGEGTSCSADSEIQSLNLSSIGVLSNDAGKVYELYNFDKMRTDINSRIMTLGGLNAERVGKVGKLTDADGNVLTAVDIVVRDKDTHEIKYMNLSVDETLVDSYIGGAGGTNSIIYTTNWFGFCYLKLYNFENYNANDYLVCNLSSNGKAVFGKDGGQDATYVLCKNYDTNNNRWTLEYKKLQISCDLSGGGSGIPPISGDTNVIGTRKSIDTKTEGNNTYHQLHNFDAPNPTTKTVDMLAKNTAYDTLDSNEYFVIKSGNEVKYKKVQIKDNTPGGGTSGYSGDVYGDHRLKYNTQGEYQIELWAKKMTYVNGLLTNVGNEELVSTLPTTPLTEEIL